MSKTTAKVSQLKAKLLWFVTLVLVGTLPAILLLIGLGVVYAIQSQWLLIILAVSFTSIAVVWLLSKLWLNRMLAKQPKSAPNQPTSLTYPHWAAFDEQVWQQQQPIISELISRQPDWRELPLQSLELIQSIAASYDKKSEYEFSVPEALRLIEEVSRRYRNVLQQQVPFIEQAKVSFLKTGIDNKKSISSGFKAYKFTYNIYRAFRTINPLAALVGEARNLVLNQLGKKLLSETDTVLKQTFLEEVGATAIDLYSGRFQGSIAETDSQASAEPAARSIRVGFIGQVSAGKSTLVNALCASVNAEVNSLPSTEQSALYQCQLTDDLALELCDLPGLDGSEKRQHMLLKQVQNCDVLIWLLKANQSSRQLDTSFQAAMKAIYQQPENRSKKPPIQIAVLNQIDLLLPAAQRQGPWQEIPDVVNQAVAYNEQLLALNVIPTSLREDATPFNLNSVMASIELQYEQAMHTQLNRQRLGGQPNSRALSEQWQRATTLSKTLFKRVRQRSEKEG